MIDRSSLAKPGSPEEALLDGIDLARLPRHVAIIMDGNGRWAKERGLPRIEGHRAGVTSVRETVETCAQIHIEALTLYAFSTENWKRPRFEVAALMALLREFLERERRNLVDNDIQFRPIGRWGSLDPAVVRELEKTMAATKACRGMIFNIALNYSGRQELTDAIREIGRKIAAGALTADQIDETMVSAHLETRGLPDPDLLIRTSGELRISNYLLWQIAYAEIWVTKTFWPDFRKRELFEAILDFQKRERRYGAVDGSVGNPAGDSEMAERR